MGQVGVRGVISRADLVPLRLEALHDVGEPVVLRGGEVERAELEGDDVVAVVQFDVVGFTDGLLEDNFPVVNITNGRTGLLKRRKSVMATVRHVGVVADAVGPEEVEPVDPPEIHQAAVAHGWPPC